MPIVYNVKKIVHHFFHAYLRKNVARRWYFKFRAFFDQNCLSILRFNCSGVKHFRHFKYPADRVILHCVTQVLDAKLGSLVLYYGL